MANELTPSDIRKDMAKDRSGNTGNGNSRRGKPSRERLNLRDERSVPEEVLRKEINRGKREVAEEVGRVSFSENEAASRALKYFTYISVSLQSEGKEPPNSVSHARRYSYENQQHEFWRDRLVRALREI